MHIIPKNVILLSQVLGIFPLLFTLNSKNQRVVVFSRKLFAWGLAVLTIQFISIYTGFFLDYFGKLKGIPVRIQNNKSVLANLLDLVPLNLVVIVVFFSAAAKYPRFIEMSSLLNRFDNILKHPGYKLNLWVEVILPLMHIILQETSAIAYESLMCLRINKTNLFAVFIPGFYISYVVAMAFVIHFSYVTRSITWRFKMLKEAFKTELSLEDRPVTATNKQDINVSGASDSCTSPVQRLKILADVYWTLCDAVEEANSFYSLQILGVIFLLFAELVISSYYLFLEIWPVIDPATVPHMFIQTSWIFTNSAMMVAIVWPSTAVTNAADEIGTTVCKLMTKQMPRETRNQLNLFLRQLPHHCARFSALGFFEVRNHILTSIAGSVTTYLVILIQFYTNSKK